MKATADITLPVNLGIHLLNVQVREDEILVIGNGTTAIVDTISRGGATYLRVTIVDTGTVVNTDEYFLF